MALEQRPKPQALFPGREFEHTINRVAVVIDGLSALENAGSLELGDPIAPVGDDASPLGSQRSKPFSRKATKAVRVCAPMVVTFTDRKNCPKQA